MERGKYRFELGQIIKRGEWRIRHHKTRKKKRLYEKSNSTEKVYIGLSE